MKLHYKLIVIILLSIGTDCFSQNTLSIGVKSYPATPEFRFVLSDFIFRSKSAPIQIGKKGNAGVLLISAESPHETRCNISGLLYLYLENGDIISLQNKIGSDYVDDRIFALYSISAPDIDKLKYSNILKVRFTYTNFLGTSKGLTAGSYSIMPRSTLDPPIDWDAAKVETKNEVKKLFP